MPLPQNYIESTGVNIKIQFQLDFNKGTNVQRKKQSAFNKRKKIQNNEIGSLFYTIFKKQLRSVKT